MLLPPEYSALLSDIPELREYKDLYTAAKPLFCVSPPTAKPNSTQFSPFPDGQLSFVFMYIHCVCQFVFKLNNILMYKIMILKIVVVL